jgi:uncharacterized membrane protein
MENENQNTEEQLVRDISLPMFSSKGWIKFLGIIMLIYGIFAAISIVGILIAWLPIWIGVLLLQASSRIEQAHLSGSKESLIRAQNSLSTYFTVYGVLALIGIIISVVFTIVFFATGMFAHLQDLTPNYY